MINQPNTIESAKDLENLIENYRGQITLQEQSISQNKKFIVSQEYTIGQNDLRIKELDTFIKEKESKVEELTLKVKELEEKEIGVSGIIESSRKELSDLMSDIQKTRTDHELRKSDFVRREAALKDREDFNSQKESNLQQQEREISLKHDKIRAFKETI